jgi:hypothetical protein
MDNNWNDKFLSFSPQEFPRPFVSDWFDDGSRTIDLGQQFTFEVKWDGFHAKMETGPWSVSDLFGELGYWPTKVVWNAIDERLDVLLLRAAEAANMAPEEITSTMAEYISEYEAFDLEEYLKREVGCPSTELVQFRTSWANRLESFRLEGLPSEPFQKGTHYRGLELCLNKEGWSAVLSEPEPDDHIFQPTFWVAGSFDGLLAAEDDFGWTIFDYHEWEPEDLAAELVEDDVRWMKFLDLS